MLSQSMTDAINKQINWEMYSSHLYLQMSSWCAFKGFEGCANFLNKHASEERMHMRKLLAYLSETGGLAILGQINAPPTQFSSIRDLFEKTFHHEQSVTQKINELVHQATTEKDYATRHFLQWYVAEQHQEKCLFKSILDKIDMIGMEGQGLFFIDREVGKMATQKGQEATAMTSPESGEAEAL